LANHLALWKSNSRLSSDTQLRTFLIWSSFSQ